MPYIEGNTYAELNIYPTNNKELVVALISVSDEVFKNLVHKIFIATAYISDKFKGLCSIRLITVSSAATEKYKKRYQYETFTDLEMNSRDVIDFAKTNNIDVLYSDDKTFIQEFYKEAQPFELADSIEQLELEIEAYLTGKDVAWSLSVPTWNSTWLSKSMDNKALMYTLNTLLNAAQAIWAMILSK